VVGVVAGEHEAGCAALGEELGLLGLELVGVGLLGEGGFVVIRYLKVLLFVVLAISATY
jgi:hypothetical protein